MTEIFYYIGIVCIINDLLPLIFRNEIDEVSAIKESVKIPDGFFKYIAKKWFRVVLGIVYILWVICGIVMTEQRSLFVFLFCLIVFAPFVIFSMQEVKRQKQFTRADSILSIVIVGLILFNHFYLHIN